MSNSQYAFLSRSEVPDLKSLEASIKALEFNLTLHESYVPFESSGLLPCVLNGEDGLGFEIGFQDSAEVIDGEDPLASIASGKECCISMVWRSSMKDLACVMIVSCALVKDFGAVVSYEGGAPMEISDLLFATRELLRGVTNEV